MAKSRAQPKSPVQGIPRPWSEFMGIALLAVGTLMAGGLFSYQGGGDALMGPVGHLLAEALYASFGMGSYLVTLGVLAVGVRALLGRRTEIHLGEGIGFSVATLAGCVLLHVTFPLYRIRGYATGGLIGEVLGEVSLGLFSVVGTYLVALTILCLGLVASTPFSAAHLVTAGRMTAGAAQSVGRYLAEGFMSLLRTQREIVDEARAEEAERRTNARRARAPETAVDETAEYEQGEYDDEFEADDGEEEAYDDDAEVDDDDEDVESDADDEADDESDEDDEADEEDEDDAAASRKRRSKAVRAGKGAATGADARRPPSDNRGSRQHDLPEIVVQNEADAASTDKRGKKAPPRPEELNKSTGTAATIPSVAPKPKEAVVPGIIHLTDEPYRLPPLHLLEVAEKIKTEFDRGFVLEQAERLVNALSEFKIRGKVTKIHPGPVITRYEFKPEAGVKLSKIESLENDIAMALEAMRIRILAPIPGKSTVGFEVPNKLRETVYIKEILADDGFGNGAKLPLALGKDITGKSKALDLTKAPHLLVAGATGSGKSVGINTMICSLLYTCSPDDVRMIMIDPKMLELSIYEGIPHLLLPVVTDAEKANLALRWAVDEMERRYELLSRAQVRDIAGYNRKLDELVTLWQRDLDDIRKVADAEAAAARNDGEDAAAGRELEGIRIDIDGSQTAIVGDAELPEKPTKLPYVVVIIDEFADLMMVASKEVEQSVARIAAKARAAGIHLIVATQRPSVDVITGTIKNNFPSRIAFQVTSDADSRTILDGKGAKQLLGMGDMLHMDRGADPYRVHGCFVSEDEILKVVAFVKKQAKPVYNMDIVRRRDDQVSDGEGEVNLDPLYDRAVQIVAEAQKVSTSMLQRRLNIGYNRAAKIVEKMEQQGVIGPQRGTAPREVYVSAA